MTPAARWLRALTLRIAVDMPKIDCVLSSQAMADQVSWANPRNYPITHESTVLTQAVRRGKVRVRGRRATLSVRFRDPTCRPRAKAIWRLERVGRHWRVSKEGRPSFFTGECFLTTASGEQSTVFQAALARNAQAILDNDAQTYCQSRDIALYRIIIGSRFAYVEGVIDKQVEQQVSSFHFDCVAETSKVPFSPLHRDFAHGVLAAIGQTSWQVHRGIALSSPIEVNGQRICLMALESHDGWKAGVPTDCGPLLVFI